MRGKLLDAFRSIVTIFAMRNDIFIVTVQRQIPALLLRRQHQERVRAGLVRARAQGTVLGRPKVAASVETQIRRERAKGKGILKIAKELGLGTSVVQRVLKAA